MAQLKDAAVAVFGLGGVGSYVVEALARSGVGRLDLFDHDTVCLTNINRQLIATHETIGQKKVDIMKKRSLDINPACLVSANACFYNAQNADEFDFSKYSYVVDAIDTVSSKLLIIERAKQAGVPVISCMGTGNKLDPTRFEVADIYETSVCPLARVMRRELRARGILSLKVVYSREEPIRPEQTDMHEGGENCCRAAEDETGRAGRPIPGSVSFVPSVAGLILACEVIQDLCKPAKENTSR